MSSQKSKQKLGELTTNFTKDSTVAYMDSTEVIVDFFLLRNFHLIGNWSPVALKSKETCQFSFVIISRKI